MGQIYLKPKEGALVRNPKSMQILPEVGTYVEYNSYWRRRVKDGSVIVGKPERKPLSSQNNKKEERE